MTLLKQSSTKQKLEDCATKTTIKTIKQVEQKQLPTEYVWHTDIEHDLPDTQRLVILYVCCTIDRELEHKYIALGWYCEHRNMWCVNREINPPDIKVIAWTEAPKKPDL